MNDRLLCCTLLCAALAACGASTTSRDTAQGYALDNLACSADTDCCIVFDGCKTEGLVVLAKDRSTVADLLAKAPQDLCTACMNPALQARCDKGICIGKIIQESSGCDYTTLQPFETDHCGVITVPTGCAEVSPTRGSALRISCGGTAH